MTPIHTPSRRGPSAPAGFVKARIFGRKQGAFTLVEILIVVVILGILAAIVIPQFSGATTTTRENTLKELLHSLRTQITVYAAQHQDVAPGYPAGQSSGAASSATMLMQLTQYSDQVGNTSATYSAVDQFGPYLQQFPANPINNLNTVEIVSDGAAFPAADGTTGWSYQPQTQQIAINLAGNDSTGMPYSSY
jgi:general secretion pathway protein G